MGLAFSPDGKRLASASMDLTVLGWDAATGRATLRYGGQMQAYLAVAFSPAGKRLAACGMDGSVYLCDLGTGQEVLGLKTSPLVSYEAQFAFLPNGRHLVRLTSEQATVWRAPEHAASGKVLPTSTQGSRGHGSVT